MGRTTDLAIRLMTGERARPSALASQRPPPGATESPTYTSQPHQPLWPAYEGPSAVALSQRSLYGARCIEKIADSISGLPFQAGNMVSRTPRATTQLQQLLGPAPGGPNPLWSAAMLWRYVIIQYLILGKFALLHEYDQQGRIIALWPLMAQHLVPVVAAPGAAGYFESFRYGTRGTQGFREFTPSQITYIWRPSQADIRIPEAPLRLAGQAIVISQLLNQFDHAFLSNGGVPAHMVITPPFEDGVQRRAFRDQFKRKFGGASNAGKVAFAEALSEPGEFGSGAAPQASVDIKTIGLSQKDSELNTLRIAKNEDQSIVFGVPLSLLGVSAGSKYTNMQTDRENYWKETIKPYLREFEDHINLSLATKMDGPKDIGWFDISSIPELRKAPVFTEAGGINAVAAGLISPNTYRLDRGLPADPAPDMDVARPRPLTIRDTFTMSNPAPGANPDQLPPNPAKPPVGKKDQVVPPVKAKAVREDLLGIVREQLGTELADQRRELEQRLAGKRGGKNRAHAQLNLGLAYDTDHWAQRMARNLTPSLRAMGLLDGEITDWSQDITASVQEHLSMSNAMGGVFDPDAWMDSLAQPGSPPSHGVEAGFIESALLQIHGGQMDASGVLSAIHGAA